MVRFYSVSGARQLGSRSRRSTAARGSPAAAGKGTEPRDGPARCHRSPQVRRDPAPVLLPEVPSPSARSSTGSAGSQSLLHYRKWGCPLQARPHAAANTQHPLRPGRNYSSQQLSGGRCVVTSRVSASGRAAPRRAVPCRACRGCRRCRPQRRVGAAAMLEEAGEVLESVLKASCLPLSFLLFVPAVLLLLGPPPAAEAAHEFTVYRMQQYELGGQPYGERRPRALRGPRPPPRSAGRRGRFGPVTGPGEGGCVRGRPWGAPGGAPCREGRPGPVGLSRAARPRCERGTRGAPRRDLRVFADPLRPCGLPVRAERCCVSRSPAAAILRLGRELRVVLPPLAPLLAR